jgi:hypothetical protein
VFPLFAEGALSPADDLLDFGIVVDLVPFWTMAVANVYRKSRRIAVTAEESREQHPALKG